MDLEQVKHRLSYHGEIVSDLEPMVWIDPLERHVGIANGDIRVFMKIKIEFNFLLFGRDAFKVSYPNQPPQCSVCYSFAHRANACDRRHIGRVSLHWDYLQKWKRLVGYEDIAKHDEGETEEKDGEPSEHESNDDENEDVSKVAKNLQDAFDAQADSTNQGSLNITSPGGILENFEEVYESQQGSDEVVEKPPKESPSGMHEPNLSVAATNKTENAKDDASLQPNNTDNTSTVDSAGWEQVKQRRPRRGAKKSSDSSNSTASESEELPDIDPKKRKAGSPKENEIKKTGSGRKKGHHAERTKSIFFTEHTKTNDEAATVGDSVVKKEKIRRDLTSMENKYYTLLFQNPSGPDPESNENWREIKKALDDTRLLLDKKSPSS